MRDCTIIYQGGSAGFMYFYFMLLSGNYSTDIPGTDSISGIKSLIKQQFPESLKSNRKIWKQSETWPLNDLSVTTSKPKLYLICNPFFNEDSISWCLDLSQGTDVILIYTDIRTQIRLAYDKQAYWFTANGKIKFNNMHLRDVVKSGVKLGEIYVDPDIPRIISVFSPKLVYLQDVLQQGNSDQQDFVRHWLSLQSTKSQKLLCK